MMKVMFRNFLVGSFFCLVGFLQLSAETQSKGYEISYDASVPQLVFSVSELIEELEQQISGSVDGLSVHFQLSDKSGEQGGFKIKKAGEQEWIVLSADVNGLMYGGLELAEQMSLHGAFHEKSVTPYVKRRGLKMNFPLDARTPSYDDTGDAAQQNIAEMWSWEFWEAYLDHMAKDRYNVLTLWNPHPFPSMVKLENYPDVALDDVQVTTLKPTGIEHEWAEPQMVSSNVISNTKVIKEIGIDEKIAFWQKVMKRAHERGIDLYFFTWNICPNGAAKAVEPGYKTYHIELWDEEPGSNGVTNQMDNPITASYYRDTIKTFLETYPYVKGIGVTAGEHMMNEAGNYTREQWIWEAYGLGILDAKKSNPEREVDFIHRVWNTNMDKIKGYWDDYPDSFEASFKYAKARLYSTPKPPFADRHLDAMEKYGLKSWWNLRNDDIFVHRWGDPEYVREFINNFDMQYTAGFYMGSDGYVWGREFIGKNEALSGVLEFEKHWYKFMSWGRLAYENDLPTEFFIQKLQERYPDVDAQLLYETWKASSEIIPLVNRFHWRDWDYQWSVEGCINMRDGFHTVLDFIDNPTLKDSGLMNPKTTAEAIVQKTKVQGTSSYEVSEQLLDLFERSIDGVEDLRGQHRGAEFNELLDDICSMAWLGKYYSEKIIAATEVAQYQLNGNQKHRNKAITVLREAKDSWEGYTNLTTKNYRPQMLARARLLDWREIMSDVEEDISIVEGM